MGMKRKQDDAGAGDGVLPDVQPAAGDPVPAPARRARRPKSPDVSTCVVDLRPQPRDRNECGQARPLAAQPAAVLGLDLSTYLWAIARLENGQLVEVVELWAPTVAMPAEERLWALYGAFKHWLWPEHFFRPLTLVGVEQANHTRNARTQALLLTAYTLCHVAVREQGIPFYGVHNGTWKRLLGVHGVGRTAQKAMARDMARLFYPQLADATQQDVFDAVGVAHATWSYVQEQAMPAALQDTPQPIPAALP